CFVYALGRRVVVPGRSFQIPGGMGHAQLARQVMDCHSTDRRDRDRLPGAAARTARTHTAHVAQQGSCAVPGTYRIGPRVLPLAGAARGRASVQTPVAGAVTAVP